MNFTLHLIMLGVLVVLTIGAGLYRKWMEDHCDNYLHLSGNTHDSSLITAQTNICKKLEVVDKVRRALIVAVIVYAVAIAGFATYNAWIRSGMQ